MQPTKILLVDDDAIMLEMLGELLQAIDFEVTKAHNVPEALKQINAARFDVLVTDLHMPGAGDGLTVISAMRHSNPETVTILFSAFPEMDAAAQAILKQTDQILVKPAQVESLVAAITDRLASGPPALHPIESVAEILKRTREATIAEWFARIQTDAAVMSVALTREQRCGHLPRVIDDLVHRLRSLKPIGSKEIVSPSAAQHGRDRSRQGYTAAMLVEESRMLQVSIFNTLRKNLGSIDFSILLTEVMTIADEIDSQLSQAMTSFSAEPPAVAVPSLAA